MKYVLFAGTQGILMSAGQTHTDVKDLYGGTPVSAGMCNIYPAWDDRKMSVTANDKSITLKLSARDEDSGIILDFLSKPVAFVMYDSGDIIIMLNGENQTMTSEIEKLYGFNKVHAIGFVSFETEVYKPYINDDSEEMRNCTDRRIKAVTSGIHRFTTEYSGDINWLVINSLGINRY